MQSDTMSFVQPAIITYRERILLTLVGNRSEFSAEKPPKTIVYVSTN